MKRTALKRTSPLQRRSKNPKAVSRLSLGNLLSEWVRQSPCWRCGRPADHAHHLLSRGSEPCLKLCPLNLMPLCASCHSNAHLSPVAFRVYVECKKPGLYDRLRSLRSQGWSKKPLDEVEKEVREAMQRPWSERFREAS